MGFYLTIAILREKDMTIRLQLTCTNIKIYMTYVLCKTNIRIMYNIFYSRKFKKQNLKFRNVLLSASFRRVGLSTYWLAPNLISSQ